MSDDLEQQLRQLIPVPPSPNLDARIASILKKPAVSDGVGYCAFPAHKSHPSSSNRLLLSTLSLAAASLLLIITLLTTDYLSTPASPSLAQNPNTPSLANTRLLLAQLTRDQSP